MRNFDLCRICLIEETSNKPMHALFDTKNPRCAEIVLQIKECGGIEVREHLELPHMICFQCLEALQTCCKFRHMCQASEDALQDAIIKLDLDDELDSDETDVFLENQMEFIDAKQKDQCGTEIAWLCKSEKNKSLDVQNTINAESKSKGKRRPKINKLRNLSTPRNSGQGSEKSDENRKIIMCELCGNTYSQKRLLKAHMAWHSEENQFLCEICNKNMSSSSALSRHMRTHTGEKPFVCKYCGRKFTDRSSIIRHERTHTNERPYCCQTCGKCFSYSNSLTTHMLTHTGEKRFNCLPCKKSFACMHHLKQHHATSKHQKTLKNKLKGNTELDTMEQNTIEEDLKEEDDCKYI